MRKETFELNRDELKQHCVGEEGYESLADVQRCQLVVHESVSLVVNDLVDIGFDINAIAETIAVEAKETMEFLIKRNASPESIAGMAVLVYHANKILALTTTLVQLPTCYLGVSHSERMAGC